MLAHEACHSTFRFEALAIYFGAPISTTAERRARTQPAICSELARTSEFCRDILRSGLHMGSPGPISLAIYKGKIVAYLIALRIGAQCRNQSFARSGAIAS